MDVSATRSDTAGATVPHIVAGVGPLWLAIVADDVVELFIPERILPLPLAQAGIAGLCHLRGRAAAAIDLRHVFPDIGIVPARAPVAIGLEGEGGFFALLVDDIDGLAAIDPGTVEAVPTALDPFASGACRHGTRTLICIDTARLLAEAQRISAAALARGDRQSA